MTKTKAFVLLLVFVAIFRKASAQTGCESFVGHWNQSLLYTDVNNSSKCCSILRLSAALPPTPAENAWSELMLYWGYAVVGFDMGLPLYESSNSSQSTISGTCTFNSQPLVRCTGNDPKMVQNFATPKIDLGFIYGNNAEQESEVRVGPDSCYLKLTPSSQFLRFCNRSVFPAFTNSYQGEDVARCSADPRAAVFPQVLALHTLLANEHNNRCRKQTPMFYPGSHYYVVKRQVISLVQKITMYEWLPALVGGIHRIPQYVPLAERQQEAALNARRVEKRLYGVTNEQQLFMAELLAADAVATPIHTSAEFQLVMSQLFLAGTSGLAQFQSVNGEVLFQQAYESIYNGNSLNLANDGMCRVLSGSRGASMRSIGLSVPETLSFFQQNYESACVREFEYNLPTYAQAVALAHQFGRKLYPTVDTSELPTTVTSLSDISRNPDTIAALMLQYLGVDSANETEVLLNVDLWTGLLLESHGPKDDDVLGPLARYILVSELVNWRDNDPEYFENLPGHDVVLANSLSRLLNNQCDSLIEYKEKKAQKNPISSMAAYSYDLLQENMQQMHTVDNSADQTVVIVIIVLIVFIFAIFILIGIYCGSKTD